MQPGILADKNKSYIIRSFRDKGVALRMLSMGILPGEQIKIIAKSPFGGCYYIEVGNRWMAAREEELSSIEWSEVILHD